MPPACRAWVTVFVAVCLQATPYVLLGSLLAAAFARLPAGWQRRWLPRRTLFAVPLLGLAGTALPGCECGTVPTAAAMVQRGVAAGPAMSFMVAAPSANPVVLAATAAAYPGQPAVVAARFAGGLLTAFLVGTLTARGVFGRPVTRTRHRHPQSARTPSDLAIPAADEFMRSLGLLTVGAATAACAAVLIPPGILEGLAGNPLVATISLAVLATVLCICSQADAFVARSFAGFSRTAQLAFMVVGAAVDLKVVAMQTGAFGARFTLRFATGALVVATLSASAVAWLVL